MLCSLLLTSLVLEQRSAHFAQQQHQNYGSALARMAAQQAVDATLNHDLVSLQVILQDVAANPGVLLATIHDVENNLLVQAGNPLSAHTRDEGNTHSAPITLHDSVAGYVTVSLTPADIQRGPVWLAVTFIALLLVVVAGLSFYENRENLLIRRTAEVSQKRPSSEDPSRHDDDIDDDYLETPAYGENADTAQETAPLEEGVVFLRLRLINLRSLRQQLNADLFNATASGVQQVMHDVVALYNGELQDPVGDGTDEYLLQFRVVGSDSSESRTEAALRAMCSAYLISRLLDGLSPARVSVAAVVAPDTPDHAPARATVLLADELAVQMGPQHKLILKEAQAVAGFQQLDDFQQPLRNLLQKQFQQLGRQNP